MSAHDRRSTGTQTDDETMEWKANNHVPAQYKDLRTPISPPSTAAC
jgi:hypothetical protein